MITDTELERLERLEAAPAVPEGERWRHKKRGTEYLLVGIGKMQCDWWQITGAGSRYPVDMRDVVIYRSADDGSLWVRPREEFEDGRFERLAAAPEAPGQVPSSSPAAEPVAWMFWNGPSIQKMISFSLPGDYWQHRVPLYLAPPSLASAAGNRKSGETWQPTETAPRDGSYVLLLMGETIPKVPDIRVGSFINGSGAEELGYREYAKYGGWLIWNDGSDFYVIDVEDPLAWCPPPKKEGTL